MARRLDLAYLLPKATDPEAWGHLTRLFLPRRPYHSGPGAAVWLKHGDRFVWSYQIEAIVEEEARVSDIDGRDFGPGISLLVSSPTRENKSLASVDDPAGASRNWGRGFLYLDRGATTFVRVGRRPSPPAKLLRLAPFQPAKTDPIEIVTDAEARQAKRVETQLLNDYVAWRDAAPGTLHQVVIPIFSSSAELRTDLYDSAKNVLFEAKSSASRNALRFAVGQLLDYQRYISPLVHRRPRLAILVPSRPSVDMMGLLEEVGAAAIWREGATFTDSANGQFTQ